MLLGTYCIRERGSQECYYEKIYSKFIDHDDIDTCGISNDFTGVNDSRPLSERLSE